MSWPVPWFSADANVASLIVEAHDMVLERIEISSTCAGRADRVHGLCSGLNPPGARLATEVTP